MAIVTYDHVTKQFDGTVAVKDLMIEVEDGEFLVLVGPSGPGALGLDSTQRYTRVTAHELRGAVERLRFVTR